LENKRILPYFHLSVQSGSDKILQSMWRHYNLEHLENVINKLKNLNKSVPVNIWADIIVGFPWETDEDFQKTKKLCEKHISKLHVFPFSDHQLWDTVPASKIKEQIDLQTKKEREKILMEICDKNNEKLIETTKWKKVQVLIEQHNSGWTENYLKFQSKRNLENWEIYEFIY
jgi:threonylcarbamoyladenosine tRNA methylthiotransferase MtaB